MEILLGLFMVLLLEQCMAILSEHCMVLLLDQRMVVLFGHCMLLQYEVLFEPCMVLSYETCIEVLLGPVTVSEDPNNTEPQLLCYTM